VLDEQSSFSIVARRQIEHSNAWSSSSPTSIEDSHGNRYTQIGTVKLTWFRPGRPTTFLVGFAVVEEDLRIMILGKEACEDAKVRRELQLCPFGLAPGGGKTKKQKEDGSQREKEKAEEVRKRREEQVQAQTAAEQQKRVKEQQASGGGQTPASHVPPQGGHGQQQRGFGLEPSPPPPPPRAREMSALGSFVS
jgi:hypothetical protein